MAKQHPIAPLPDFNSGGGTTEVAGNINAVAHTIAPMPASADACQDFDRGFPHRW
jgi:hypothetical protein